MAKTTIKDALVVDGTTTLDNKAVARDILTLRDNGTDVGKVFDGGNVYFGSLPVDNGFRLEVNGQSRFNSDITLADARSIIVGTGTGTKIGTATNQKLGFWNAAPIVQPTTGGGSATLVGGGGTTITDTDKFDGYTIGEVVKALRNIGLLQ